MNNRRKTIYFGKFPEDTKADIIIRHVKEWTKTAEDHIEEVYALGKFAERGAARFKSEALALDFMVQNRGMLQFDACGTKVYASPDSTHDPAPNRTKAVRKVVRMLIERNGGDGNAVKKDIATNYAKGKVWWKDCKFAEWDEKADKMMLVGEGTEYQEDYDKLMGHE